LTQVNAEIARRSWSHSRFGAALTLVQANRKEIEMTAHKQVLFRSAAREKILRGTAQLADAVRVTLGPRSKSVLMERKWGPPIVCNDGVTIAKELSLKDPEENLGAQMLRQAAEKTGDLVGDGTSTATILAHAIFADGVRNVVAGASAIDIKRGLDRASKAAIETLRSLSRPVATPKEKAQIATISAHNDPAIGELVANAIEKVGDEGVITVEEAKTTETALDVVEGMQFDRGHIAPYFITDRLIPVDESIAEDDEMKALVADAVAPTRFLHDDIGGHTDRLLHRATCLDAPMDDVLLTAIARAAGTRIAFSNGWRYGAPIPPGRVTAHDLLCMVPMNPPIQTVELTGTEVRAMMEDSLESTFSADPLRQRGGYVKRFRGLVFNVKLENPHGARIQAAFTTDGDLLVEDRIYRAAYITVQGVPERYGGGRETLSVRTNDALRDWFAAPDQDDCDLGRLRIC
jgi:hypothetical protein